MIALRTFRLLPFAFCLLLLSACTATRPVVKLGLIAPFEGLYRQSGYEALSAMRAAIAENPAPGVDVLPLALDSSADPEQARRTAQKLLTDPTVVAVVGPLLPVTADAVADVILSAGVPWSVPGFPAGDSEAVAFVAAVATQARALGAERVALAGWTPGWPELAEDEWRARTGLPVRWVQDAGQVGVGEAVLWLGDAAGGAAFLAQLRTTRPEARFWTTAVGGDPVFYRRAWAALRGGDPPLPLGPVYWAMWLDEGYETWAEGHTPGTASAYAVYRATQRALGITGGGTDRLTQRLRIFQLQPDGRSTSLPTANAP